MTAAEETPEEHGQHAEGARPTPHDVPPVSAESLVDGELRERGSEDQGERTYPSTLGGAFYLVLLAAAGVALGIIVLGSWRTGVRAFGGVLVTAASLRLVLGPRDAGMLAVRGRFVDAGLLGSVGAVLILLASSIPDQPV